MLREEFLRSQRSALVCPPEEDRAIQSDRHETNINAIVARFRTTGVSPAAKSTPLFGDFSQEYDLRSVFDVQRAARESFDSLPAEVRRRFSNSPLELAEFLSDPRNRSEAQELGLLREPPAPVSPAEAVSPPAEG